MRNACSVLLALCLVFLAAACAQATPPESRSVPAFTAFVTPNPEGAQVSESGGLTGWKDARNRVFWCGKFARGGQLHVRLVLRLPEKAASTLRLTVAKQARTANIRGEGETQPVTADFGTVSLPASGYYRLTLQGVARDGPTFGDLNALLLSGPAARDAQFNLRPEQRGAPSVHLSYPLPPDTQATWFYNEVTARTDPLWSYYMACGWHRGYFGIQVNSPTERRIIFSVWDSGSEAVDRSKVKAEDRVQLVAKGAGVFADSFGNEGTGGHSHLVYPWKKGQTYRFLVTAQPEGTATVYSGYFYFPEKRQWGLIASFRAPKDGGYLRGLYSFDEDFWGANGYLRRLAEFGNQWIKTPEGRWTELTTARFTHTGKTWRTDYDAGATQDRFYLAGGGFMDGRVKYGDTVRRPASGKSPQGFLSSTHFQARSEERRGNTMPEEESRGAGGAGATVIVATKDSSARSRAKADFVGDGNGDQEEITAALHALPPAGGTVLLMEGTYDIRKVPGKLGGVILDRSNVTLRGQGSSTRLILAPGQSTNVIRIIGSGIGNITLRDLWVDQNRDQNPDAPGDPNVSHSRFEFCGIKAFCEVPGRTAEPIHDVTVMNCTVRNSRTLGIMLEGVNMRVLDNVLGNATSDAVEILMGPGIIRGNFIEITGRTHVGVGSDRADSIIMAHNILHVKQNGDIDIGFRSWANSQRHVISDNVIQVDAGGKLGLAMDVRGFAATVTGNTIQWHDASNRLPLWLTGANILVTGNYFENVTLLVNDQTGTNKPILIKDNLMENSVIAHQKGNLQGAGAQ